MSPIYVARNVARTSGETIGCPAPYHDILKTGLDTNYILNWKGNLTDSTLWNIQQYANHSLWRRRLILVKDLDLATNRRKTLTQGNWFFSNTQYGTKKGLLAKYEKFGILTLNNHLLIEKSFF